MVAHPIALGIAVFISLAILAPDDPSATVSTKFGKSLAMLVAAVCAAIAVWPGQIF